MKQQKIYMKAWLDAHGRAKAVDTDEWYLDFANQLLPLVADSFIYGGREWEEDQKRVALDFLENQDFPEDYYHLPQGLYPPR